MQLYAVNLIPLLGSLYMCTVLLPPDVNPIAGNKYICPIHPVLPYHLFFLSTLYFKLSSPAAFNL
jgi:hypothetical protein